MYSIFVDEAGTSAVEPVSVVVGVIAHADSQIVAAEDALQTAISIHVPSKFKINFNFHAKDIWGSPKYREQWSKLDRINFISEILKIPRSIGLPISLGKVRRDWLFTELPKQIKLSQFHHMMAFGDCLARADKHIRDFGQPGETATVIAENAPKMIRYLNLALERHRQSALDIPLTPEYINLTKKEKELGQILQTNAGQVTRIIDNIRFCKKGEAPLLQISDACAFALRRYFSEQEYGADWIRAMFGKELTWEDWQGPISAVTFTDRSRLRPNPLVPGL